MCRPVSVHCGDKFTMLMASPEQESPVLSDIDEKKTPRIEQGTTAQSDIGRSKPSSSQADEGSGLYVSLSCLQAGQMLLAAIVSLAGGETSNSAVVQRDNGDREYCIETSLQTFQSFQHVLSVLCRLKEAAEDEPPSVDGTVALEGIISLLRVNIRAMVDKLSEAVATSGSDGNPLMDENNRDVNRRPLSRDAASAQGAASKSRTQLAGKAPVSAAVVASPATSGQTPLLAHQGGAEDNERFGNRQQDDGDNSLFGTGNRTEAMIDGTGLDLNNGGSNNSHSHRAGNNSSLTRDDSYASLDSLEAAAVTESNKEEFKHVLVRSTSVCC